MFYTEFSKLHHVGRPIESEEDLTLFLDQLSQQVGSLWFVSRNAKGEIDFISERQVGKVKGPHVPTHL